MRIENAKCTKQTVKGLLIEVHEDSEVYKQGTEGVLIVEDWLAEARGWE